MVGLGIGSCWRRGIYPSSGWDCVTYQPSFSEISDHFGLIYPDV